MSGGWVHHSGKAVALALESVDTDQLIPARFMSVPRAQGYGDFLLYDMRRDEAGALLTDFPLNRHPKASVLIAGRNFGSGSSREAAVYALVDAGFRAVIAPSFGDIFAANAVNNGLLPARVSEADITALASALEAASEQAKVDLAAGQIAIGATRAQFALDDGWREKLINGWDDIDLTGQHAPRIAAYQQARAETAPWVWPKASPGGAQ